MDEKNESKRGEKHNLQERGEEQAEQKKPCMEGVQAGIRIFKNENVHYRRTTNRCCESGSEIECF
jgi:hypothetical protein